MRLNIARTTERTHEGAPARRISPLAELRRSVLSCLLWEGQFYEDGVSIADRIKELSHKCDPVEVSRLALEARSDFKLRHVPLLLARELARHPQARGRVIGDTIAGVIRRADEIPEFLAIYWKDGREPVSKQAKIGLARAFHKFDEYQLAKYDRKGQVRLRDSLFLCHAKPRDAEQEALWRRLVDGELKAPDTWEVALSGGEDKRDTFERLVRESRLGYMALLRNLRNMQEAGVTEDIIFDALRSGAAKSMALPFRFLSAAKAVPQWEPVLDEAMQKSMEGMPKLGGKTIILVDVSGSMGMANVSSKSDLTRMDAAAALAVLGRGVCENCRVLTFSNDLAEVPPRNGMALIDAVVNSQPNMGTRLGAATKAVNDMPHDRLIVITDEQSHDPVPKPKGRGYMVNVASYQRGVGYGPWVHIDGFSEAVMRFIRELEDEAPTESIAA